MASTLYILLPSKAVARERSDWSEHPRSFGLVSDEGGIVQQGQLPLAALKDLAINARQVVLLLAASDVSVMSVNVPPMSPAKLKTALPNLIEELLLDDPEELILLASTPVNGACVIAAVDRSWMELLHSQMQVLEAKKLTAYSLSMTMINESEALTAIIDHDEKNIELAFRLDGKNGVGLTLDRGIDDGTQMDSARQVLQTLSLFAVEADLKVYLSPNDLSMYQRAAESDNSMRDRLHFQVTDWKIRIAGLGASSIDLMSSVSHEKQSSFDWNKWRWPLVLAAATVIMNLAGLNFQWLSMKREAQGLKDSLTQTYRSSFPKESVILDPLVQMQQKINLSRKVAGQSTPDDFLVLAAQFGQVWDSTVAVSQPASSVVSIEYREHSLFIKIKSSGALPIEQLRTGLQEHALTLVSSTDGILQIKPGRGERK